MLGFVLADLILLDGALFLLADPADVQLFGLDLSALFHFLLVRQHKQLLRHANLVNALNIHGSSVRSQSALVMMMAHHGHSTSTTSLLLVLVAMVVTSPLVVVMPAMVMVPTVAVVVMVVPVMAVRLPNARVFLRQQVVQLDVKGCHRGQLL